MFQHDMNDAAERFTEKSRFSLSPFYINDLTGASAEAEKALSKHHVSGRETYHAFAWDMSNCFQDIYDCYSVVSWNEKEKRDETP